MRAEDHERSRFTSPYASIRREVDVDVDRTRSGRSGVDPPGRAPAPARGPAATSCFLQVACAAALDLFAAGRAWSPNPTSASMCCQARSLLRTGYPCLGPRSRCSPRTRSRTRARSEQPPRAPQAARTCGRCTHRARGGFSSVMGTRGQPYRPSPIDRGFAAEGAFPLQNRPSSAMRTPGISEQRLLGVGRERFAVSPRRTVRAGPGSQLQRRISTPTARMRRA